MQEFEQARRLHLPTLLVASKHSGKGAGRYFVGEIVLSGAFTSQELQALPSYRRSWR